MINLIHTSKGLMYCKDIKIGDFVYCSDKLVEVTEKPILAKCWKMSTSIKVDVIVQNKFNTPTINFAGIHKYSFHPNYGYYALGFMQNNNVSGTFIVTGKDTAYRLARSVIAVDKKFKTVSMSGKSLENSVRTIPVPKILKKDRITKPADLHENSIRWFLQAYLGRNIRGALHIKKNEVNQVSSFKIKTEDLTPLGALMIRLANISFYHSKIEEGANIYKGSKDLKDCYVFPASELWKILSIIPASVCVRRNIRIIHGDNVFAQRFYTDALKYKGTPSGCSGANIISQEEVEDYIIPGLYPDSNGFITKEI